jgi:hypothetical protein
MVRVGARRREGERLPRIIRLEERGTRVGRVRKWTAKMKTPYCTRRVINDLKNFSNRCQPDANLEILW